VFVRNNMKYVRFNRSRAAALLALMIMIGATLFVATGVAAQAATSSQPVSAGAGPTTAGNPDSTSKATAAPQVSATADSNTDSTPCSFNPTQSCGSTYLTVAMNWWSSSGAIQLGCVWNATVDWGDGTPTQSVTITSSDTYQFLASHTYAKGGPEVIQLGGTSSTSNCTVIPGTYYFDPGQACVFYNPQLSAGLVGHVAWSYLLDPSSGTWEFGSNDGPVSYFINPTSKTWYKLGTWSSVDSTFTSKGYTSVKCLTGGEWDNVAAADAVVSAQQGTQYSIPSNDCLSDTVAVLDAYGLSLQSPSADSSILDIIDWIPVYYFNNELSGWSEASLPSASPPSQQ
jgi:hypothetical protein